MTSLYPRTPICHSELVGYDTSIPPFGVYDMLRGYSGLPHFCYSREENAFRANLVYGLRQSIKIINY